MAYIFVKLADQIKFWFNQLMGSNLVLFQTTWNKTKIEPINRLNQNLIWLANFTKN